jgi:hypothetical protein
MEVSGQRHASAALPQVPLARRLGGPQSRSGRGGEEKNDSPCRESKPRRPARNLVSIETASFIVIYNLKVILQYLWIHID